MISAPHPYPVRILIIDDDEDDFLITKDYIFDIKNGHYQVDWCPRYEDAVKYLRDRMYDLYFVDYRLGAKSGVDLLKQAHSMGVEEPFILLTGKGNYHVDMEAMHLGAIDYLIKLELSSEKLERSIRYALERAASVRALKDSERKYRSIFQNTRDIVFITDASLLFQDVNSAVTAILGYTTEQIKSMNLRDVIVLPEHKRYIADLLAEGRDVDDMELPLVSANGEKINCILTATPQQDVSGLTYVQGIIHDITNLKRAEKATLNAEKMAAAGRLVRVLAHEVRNPLNNISLSVEQLQQDGEEDQALLYLDIIDRNCKRISQIISELLTTSGPSEITLKQVRIQSVLDDVISAAIDRITLKQIQLNLQYTYVSLYIMADREKLVMALLNIVINATEAVEESTGLLKIHLTESSQQAVLEISDNGCGIPEEGLSRLFEPYYTEKKSGLGLGLSFTLNILQAHGAQVDVSSLPGKGTCFTVIFSLAGAHA